MQLNISNKLFYFVVFLALVFSIPKVKGQTINFFPSNVQCMGSSGTTSMVASLSSTLASATSFTWAITTTTTMPNVTPVVPNGSVVVIDFLICGYYSITCTAYNGTTTLSIFSGTVSVLCGPTVSVVGPPGAICSGSTTTLSASGAQNYTWAPSLYTGSQLLITPTVATSYTLIGSNSNGCTDMAAYTVTLNPVPVPNFIYAPMSPTSGVVSFSSTTSNTTNFSTFSWNFGNGATGSNSVSTATYTNNGTYTVTLSVTNNNGCGPHTQTLAVQVTNVVGTCSVDFVPNPGANGNYNFVASVVTGTFANTIFYWDFGDGTTYSATGAPGLVANHTYTNFGTFPVSLYFDSPLIGCVTNTANHAVTYAAPICSLTAGFTYSLSDLNVVDFISTSTGTSSNTIYSWFFGDSFSVTGTSAATTTHTYNLPGVYNVTLAVLDSLGSVECTTLAVNTITVSLCNLAANFTHTVGVNGSVGFSNISTTSGNVQYYWDFGDGVMSTLPNPTHVYNNAGTYYVSLKINDGTFQTCKDSLTVSINVSSGVPCSAVANFTLLSTGTPFYWDAVPAYPWNVTAATWSWGDGSVSNSLYSSHVYSVPATYSICLTVTVSCGASATYCFPYLISRSEENSSAMYYINVTKPELSTGLKDITQENDLFHIYPNPNTGTFYIQHLNQDTRNITVNVYDLVGKLVYTLDADSASESLTTIHLEEMVNGIYFVKIDAENRSFVKKLIISK